MFHLCFTYDKTIWIAATDYMPFDISVLFSLTGILQLIYFTAS